MRAYALATSLLLIVLTLTTPSVMPGSADWLCDCDHLFYWQMAQGVQAPSPFGARVMKPMLTRLMPVPPGLATALITLWSLALIGALTYTVLRRLGLTAHEGTAGSVMVYALPALTKMALSDMYKIDSLAIVFLVLAIYAALTHRFSLFTLALFFGVLTKETVIMAAPLWYVYNRRLRTQILGTLPALVALLALRLVVPPGTPYLALPGIVAAYRAAHPAEVWEYMPFGVLPIFAVLDPRGRRLLVRFAPFLTLVYAQLILATDTARLVVYGFVPIIAAALYGWRRVLHSVLHTSAWRAVPHVSKRCM